MNNNFPSQMMNKGQFANQMFKGDPQNKNMGMYQNQEGQNYEANQMKVNNNFKNKKFEKKKMIGRNNPLAQFANKKDTVIIRNIPEYYNVVNYLMNYFKKFGDISNVSTLTKEKMAAIQYKKDSDARKAVEYEGKPFDLPSLVLYIAADGDGNANKEKNPSVHKKSEQDNSKMETEAIAAEKSKGYEYKEGYKNFNNNYHYGNQSNPGFKSQDYQDQYMGKGYMNQNKPVMNEEDMGSYPPMMYKKGMHSPNAQYGHMMHNKYYGGQYHPNSSPYNAQYHPNTQKPIFNQSKSASASPLLFDKDNLKNPEQQNDPEKTDNTEQIMPNQNKLEAQERRQKEQQARMQKMKYIEDKKEIEKTKRILLQNLTQQIQLLLDFKSRETDEKMKTVIQDRIKIVQQEMKEVNNVKEIDNVNAKYGDEMTKSLDATLRVTKRDTDDEEAWKQFLDYSTCTKIFMEYGKIEGMTINKDGRTVLIKYGS